MIYLQLEDLNYTYYQSLKIIRDDIFPYIGGGNKARKALYYESHMRTNGYDALVTCGGVQSNHNRAMALMAARNGWKCHLCVQDTKERFFNEKGNALLCRMAGATCEIIKPEDTAKAMDRAMLQLQKQGYNPMYVTGGGHDIPGGLAWIDATKQLKEQCDRNHYRPDYIFHASGTGSTQAGLMVGLDSIGWNDTKVVGISVARSKERGIQVINEFADKLALHCGLHSNYSDKILFNTDYLYGGYEQYTNEMQEFLLDVTRKTGLVFDTTYSGKAFYGMMDIIEKNPELKSKNILFWHTGGIMNLMK